MIKIGGGFWPFWAGKGAVFDSEVLATLVRKFDSSPCNFAAEKESGFKTYFEQEIYSDVLLFE